MRPIALGLAAVAAAFLIAFGIGKATNGEEATGAPSRAEAIQADDAVISAEVTTAGARLPALKEERKQRPRKRQASNGSSDSSTAPQQQDSSPSQQQDTSPPPQDTSPPPQEQKPAPKRDSGESGDSGGGISGGDN
jgi:hypothetical protein